MGTFATVAVCTAVGYASSYTIYDPYIALTANFTYTGLVKGANCSFKITGDNATLANSLVEIFNRTSNGQFSLEPFGCNLTTTQACQTGAFSVTDQPYTYITEDFENYIPGISQGLAGLQDEQNFTYIVLPPVPSQPPMFFVNPTNTSVSATASIWSQEYGSALIGCVLSASPSVWLTGGSVYQGGDLPTSLSSNGAGLPLYSSAQYSISQGQSLTYQLSALNLYPSTVYDLAFSCYNGNGRSPTTSVFLVTTSSTLPQPQPKNGAASRGGAAAGWVAAALTALVLALAI